MRCFRLPLAALVISLTGCASPPPPASPQADGWQPQALPGKPATQYEWVDKEGRRAVRATARRSASMWRKRVAPAAHARQVTFSWWVQDLLPVASVADGDREDAPVRVMFGFDGDTTALPMRTRML